MCFLFFLFFILAITPYHDLLICDLILFSSSSHFALSLRHLVQLSLQALLLPEDSIAFLKDVRKSS